MNLSDVTKLRRRCVEIGKDGIVVFSGLDHEGEPLEIRITVLEKSGKKARLLLEAPPEIRIDHTG